MELWMRTLYHKLNSTRLIFHLQHWLAKRSYQRWRTHQQKQPLQDISKYSHQPKISFILSCSRGRIKDAIVTLESIHNFQGNHWEVILLSPSGDEAINLPPMFMQDTRIKLTTPDQENLLNIITGEYVIFCEAGDLFFETLLTYFYQSLTPGLPADLTYYDCEYQDECSAGITPLFKPTTISPELLLSVNYLSRGIVKCDVLRKIIDKIDPTMDLLNQEYDLTLRLCEAESVFRHIPEVLVMQLSLVKPDIPEIRKIIMEHLSQRGLEKVSFVEKPHGTRFTWKTGNPSVAIIIPSKNNHPQMETLLRSLLEKPSEPNFTIQIIDNGSDDENTLAYYKSISLEPRISIIPYNKPFNYSEAINLGVEETDSDLVLLMNDDMKVMDPDWLDELTQWAQRPEVGVVGAKLLRANRTIQHAGIIMGLNGFMGHIYLNAPEHYIGLFGSVDWYRTYLAVTGACQMVRREVFNEVGGYDEGYQLAFGDIDFCLRVHEKGYQNVYTPFARLFHFEGSSRGYQTPVGDVLRGFDKMRKYLLEDDPYFSPNLSYTRIPKFVDHDQNDRLKQVNARKQFYESAKKSSH